MVKIAATLKSSLIDYPDKISYVIFFQGCNLRCSWCSNSELLSRNPLFKKYLNEDDIILYLVENLKWYDGVVLLGGEPTIQDNLEDFCLKLKKTTGLPIKLDTNGLKPQVVKNLIKKQLIDYVAVDIKLGTIFLEDYQETKNYLINSGFPHEFRLTCVPTEIQDINIGAILKTFKKAQKIYLQNFSNKNTFDKKFKKEEPYLDSIIKEWCLKYSKELEINLIQR